MGCGNLLFTSGAAEVLVEQILKGGEGRPHSEQVSEEGDLERKQSLGGEPRNPGDRTSDGKESSSQSLPTAELVSRMKAKKCARDSEVGLHSTLERNTE